MIRTYLRQKLYLIFKTKHFMIIKMIQSVMICKKIKIQFKILLVHIAPKIEFKNNLSLKKLKKMKKQNK